jgi:hypothetical protein
MAARGETVQSVRRAMIQPRFRQRVAALRRLQPGELELNLYLDTPKAVLKVLKHFMSAICSLINSPSKLCRLEEHVAKRAFATLSLEPSDSFLDLLATFRARNFQR